MTAEDILSRLDVVRRSGRGWLARCPVPAHDDRNPSLSIREGDRGVLIRCWAGCELTAIVASLGLTVSDLFHDAVLSPHERRRARLAPKKPRPYDWRCFANEVQDKAMDHWLRGTAVLEASRGLDITDWTDADLDEAWKAVGRAQADHDRADQLDRLALTIRAQGLRKERERGPQSRRSAA